MGKVYVGSTLSLALDCELDVSGASSRSIELLPPDHVPISSPATLTGTQVLGVDVVLHQAGEWRAQPKVVIGGKTHFGETLTFEVTQLYR